MRTRDPVQQGLIQLAVALHHIGRGNVKGAKTMIERALPRLRAGTAAGPIDVAVTEAVPPTRFVQPGQKYSEAVELRYLSPD